MGWNDLFGQQKSFTISHMGEPKWEVSHSCEPPATEESIFTAEDELGLVVPDGVKDFWRFADGALLYRSAQPPIWGWRILGSQKYLEVQHKWRRKFFDEWRTSYLAVAELLNPISAVVWDCYLKKVYFLETSSGDMRATEIASSFEEFLQRLEDSQGGLYWQWV